RSTQPWARDRSLVHRELVAQGEVLQGDLAVAAAEEGKESQQVEHEGDHQTRIVVRSELIDQPLARRTAFWPRTGWKPKQLEQECNHRANILSRSEAGTQPLGPADAVLARDRDRGRQSFAHSTVPNHQDLYELGRILGQYGSHAWC